MEELPTFINTPTSNPFNEYKHFLTVKFFSVFCLKGFGLSFEKKVLTFIKIHSSVFFKLSFAQITYFIYISLARKLPHILQGNKGTAISKEQGFANDSSIQTFCGAFTKKILVCILHSSVDSIWEAQV